MDGIYTEFILIESRFQGKDLTQVQELQTSQRTIIKASERNNLQAQIHLAQHIEAVVHGVQSGADVRLKDIRITRKREQSKHHKDYLKEGIAHE